MRGGSSSAIIKQREVDRALEIVKISSRFSMPTGRCVEAHVVSWHSVVSKFGFEYKESD